MLKGNDNAVLENGEVNPKIMNYWMEHYRRLDMFIPIFDSGIKLGKVGEANFRLMPDGQIMAIKD